MVDEKIEPALTDAEWERIRDSRTPIDVRRGDEYVTLDGYTIVGERYLSFRRAGLSSAMTPVVMAVANHALPDGHPLKITRADVEWLQDIAAYLDSTDNAAYMRHDATALAAKLAALLPSEA